MAKLSLSEVSKKFHVDRSTIYRAVRNGRLSRSSDGQFDLAEVIRCFGEPEQTSQKIESSKQEGDESTKKLSELPEMGRYSQGTESYPQFAVRIAEMLQDPDRIKELYPYLKKVGYMPSNKKDTVNG